MPNQVTIRDSNRLWSTVSNAADKSLKKQDDSRLVIIRLSFCTFNRAVSVLLNVLYADCRGSSSLTVICLMIRDTAGRSINLDRN